MSTMPPAWPPDVLDPIEASLTPRREPGQAAARRRPASRSAPPRRFWEGPPATLLGMQTNTEEVSQ
jgi:hypothetical protein